MKVQIIKSLKKRKVGEIADVSFGYYKNFLSPNNIASLSNLTNINQTSSDDLSVYKTVHNLLKDFVLTFEEKGNDAGVLYSSITSRLILNKLNEYIIESRNKCTLYYYSIDLSEKIKSIGEFYVNVFLHHSIPAFKVKILVSIK